MFAMMVAVALVASDPALDRDAAVERAKTFFGNLAQKARHRIEDPNSANEIAPNVDEEKLLGALTDRLRELEKVDARNRAHRKDPQYLKNAERYLTAFFTPPGDPHRIPPKELSAYAAMLRKAIAEYNAGKLEPIPVPFTSPHCGMEGIWLVKIPALISLGREYPMKYSPLGSRIPGTR